MRKVQNVSNFLERKKKEILVFKRITFQKLPGEAVMISLIQLLHFKAPYQNILELFFHIAASFITCVICLPRVWYNLDKLITRRSQMRSSSAASVGPPASCLASLVLAHLERWPACTTPSTFVPALMETSHSSESSVTTQTQLSSKISLVMKYLF